MYVYVSVSFKGEKYVQTAILILWENFLNIESKLQKRFDFFFS